MHFNPFILLLIMLMRSFLVVEIKKKHDVECWESSWAMQVVYIKEFVYFFLFFIFFRYNQRVLIQPLCICINFCVCTWVHMCEYSCYYVLLFLLFFFLFFIFNNLSICLVRDGIRRMEKKNRERKWVCVLFGMERKDESFLVKPRHFLS